MFEPLFVPPGGASDEALWFICRNRDVLLVDGDVPRGTAPPVDGHRHFLGMRDGSPCWGLHVEGDEREPAGSSFVNLYSLHGAVEEELWVVAGRAVQIMAWDHDHKFCGRCGGETESAPNERMRRCPKCGSMFFPRLSPAVIMLVERGDEMLLAHGRQFPRPMYSTLAGFVEPGETLEQCVAREVMEEVGLEVGDITYYGSQPWPFPHSLMLGFKATYRSGEIRIQEEEIVDAGWFTADELPPHPTGTMSIAARLISSFLAGERIAGRSARVVEEAPARRPSIWERS